MTDPKTKTVLIVDDDRALLEAISTYLKIDGIQVITSSDGEDGITQAKKNHPDIILLDIMMPRLTGKEVLQALKSNESTKDIPVIIFTALIEDIEKRELIDMGAAQYLVKTDIEPEKFAVKILDIIHEHTK